MQLLAKCLTMMCIFVFGPTSLRADSLQSRLAQTVRESLVKEDRKGVDHWKKVFAKLNMEVIDKEVLSRWLALVYARNSMYSAMRNFLDEAIESEAISRELLRLRSWARLSDQEYLDGCRDAAAVIKSVKLSLVSRQFADLDVHEAKKTGHDVSQAAKSFGFCKAVSEVFGEIEAEDFEPIINACRKGLDGDLVLLFDKQLKATYDAVSPAVKDVVAREESATLSFEDEKAQKDQLLQKEQAEMAGAANQSLQAAEMVRMQAQQQLSQIESAAAPFEQQRIGLERQLALLRSQKSNDSEFRESYWDQQIYEVQGTLSGVYARLQDFQNRYQAVRADANRRLQQLGAHVQLLAKNNWAHGLRRKKNENVRRNNELRQIEAEKKRVLRFATYVELDFEREAIGLVGSDSFQGASID